MGSSPSRQSLPVLLELTEEDFERGYVGERRPSVISRDIAPEATKPSGARKKLPPPPSTKPLPKLVPPPPRSGSPGHEPVTSDPPPIAAAPGARGRSMGVLLAGMFIASLSASALTARIVRDTRVVSTPVGMEAAQGPREAATVEPASLEAAKVEPLVEKPVAAVETAQPAAAPTVLVFPVVTQPAAQVVQPIYVPPKVAVAPKPVAVAPSKKPSVATAEEAKPEAASPKVEAPAAATAQAQSSPGLDEAGF